MIRAHQPGSQPIDIPETIPNPVVVPKPTPTPTKPAPKEPVRIPEKVPLERRLTTWSMIAIDPMARCSFGVFAPWASEIDRPRPDRRGTSHRPD